MKGNLRTCKNGHQYYKSSDCPTCPVCENERKPDTGFLSLLAAPARRALENAGIKTLADLSKWSEGRLLELHGLGRTSIPKLKDALTKNGYEFKKN
jgi:predicted RecB family nuclease